MAGETKLSGPDLRADGIPSEDVSAAGLSVGHVDGKPVVLVATEDGIHAVGGSCTHYGGPLGDGFCVGGEIRCPWHHAAFDITTGEAVGAPALNPITVYETAVRESRVYVIGPRQVRHAKPAPPRAPASTTSTSTSCHGS